MTVLAGLQNYLHDESRYEYNQVHEVLLRVRRFFRFSVVNTPYKYFNVPCAFDIETTSFSERSEKRACMYEWSFCIYGLVIVGRTWEQFVSMTNDLSRELDLSPNKRLCVFIHVASFDFQFLRKWFNVVKMFSIDRLKPLYALTDNGFEFRCSWQLSGYNLENLGNELKRYKVSKMVGDLDYSKLRHSGTPLTEKEWKYCTNDVRVVVAYIAETLEEYDGIAKIPLTKTGFVRNYCRDRCFYEPEEPHKGSVKRAKYREFIKGLSFSKDEYLQLRDAFRGGFTHANPFYSGKTVSGVTSYDIASSYPTVMIANKYPMSEAELLADVRSEHDPEFTESIDYYCCVFDIELHHVQASIRFENYLSESSCFVPETYIEVDADGNEVKKRNKIITNNGRIVYADVIRTTLTDVDYNIMKIFYSWDDEAVIASFRRYERGYLPTDLVRCILDLYGQKTAYKGVAGKEDVYARSKTLINAIFGMMVTDVARDEYPYINNEWQEKVSPDIAKVVEKYNKNMNRFTFYAWGVFITAYARQNLFTLILNCENDDGTCDYIYSDTDSVKMRHAERHLDFIQLYNDTITDQLEKAMKHHKLSPDLIRPKTSKGKQKPLGIFEFDGEYSRFKTLGAKRYMVEYSDDARNGDDKGRMSVTVSGVNKKRAIPYLYGFRKFHVKNVSRETSCNFPNVRKRCRFLSLEKGVKMYRHFPDCFDLFSVGLHLPPSATGKLTHTYIDDEIEGGFVDYLGNYGTYHERSYVHLEPADYTFSIGQKYRDYLQSITDEYFE